MKKRIVALLAMVLILPSMVAFAGGKQEAVGAAKELTLYWNPQHDYKAYNKVIDGFAAEYGFKINKQLFSWPDFKTKIKADFVAGTVPDLIETPPTWFLEYATQDLLYELTDGIKSWPEHSDWFDATWKEVTYKDKIVGIKLHHTCFALFYNKDMFQKAGLDPGRGPKDLTEFEQYIDIIDKKLGPDIKSFAFDPDGQFLLPFLASAETPDMVAADNKSALGTPAIRDTLKRLQKVARSKKVVTADPGAQTGIAMAKMFINEKLAMYISGPWDVGNIMTNAPNLKYGVAMPPHVASVEARTLTAGTGLAIPKKSKYAKEAWELIKRLTSVETEVAATLEAGMLMPRKGWLKDPRISEIGSVKYFAPVLPYGVPFDVSVQRLGVPEITWTGSVFRKLYETMVYSDQDMDKALDAYIEEANRLIKRKL